MVLRCLRLRVTYSATSPLVATRILRLRTTCLLTPTPAVTYTCHATTTTYLRLRVTTTHRYTYYSCCPRYTRFTRHLRLRLISPCYDFFTTRSALPHVTPITYTIPTHVTAAVLHDRLAHLSTHTVYTRVTLHTAIVAGLHGYARAYLHTCYARSIRLRLPHGFWPRRTRCGCSRVTVATTHWFSPSISFGFAGFTSIPLLIPFHCSHYVTGDIYCLLHRLFELPHGGPPLRVTMNIGDLLVWAVLIARSRSHPAHTTRYAL